MAHYEPKATSKPKTAPRPRSLGNHALHSPIQISPSRYQNPGNNFFGNPALSVFRRFRMKLVPMRAPSLRRLRRMALCLCLEFALAAGVMVFSVWADNSSRVRQVTVGGCYCGCAQSKTSAGCGKMCELPKYATRWWAVNCKKPRVSTTPAENPGAGPRLPHPARAERASN